MFGAFQLSLAVRNAVATVLALVVTVLLFRGLRAMIRLGRPKGDRRTFSDLPTPVLGPQEVPDQSDAQREARRARSDG